MTPVVRPRGLTASVYIDHHLCTGEKEFNPLTYTLKWCNRQDYPYDEVKRQAECALFQQFPQFKGIAVRFPYVIGEDDYTKRGLEGPFNGQSTFSLDNRLANNLGYSFSNLNDWIYDLLDKYIEISYNQ